MAGPQDPVGGGVGLHLGSERCFDLYRHDRQKVILLTGPTFPAPGSAMPYDP
jgi:hypothetical protein